MELALSDWAVTSAYRGEETKRFILAMGLSPRSAMRAARYHRNVLETSGPETTRRPEQVVNMRLERWIVGKGWTVWRIQDLE